jgi:glycosyltransferase involved in cell wall biosynthesis
MEIISVLLCTYNEPLKYLKLSIESILSQTYTNIQLIIVNDNPKREDMADLLASYAREDSRIKYIVNSSNIGLVGSLNIGLKNAVGEFIARMDADDIATRDRLEKQLEFLKIKNYDLVGCNAIKIDEDGKEIGCLNVPTAFEKIKEYQLYGGCVLHPTWLGKREVFEKLKGYRSVYACEDFDFILRAIQNGFKIGNMPTYGLYYRIRTGSVSSKANIRQKLTMYYLIDNGAYLNVPSVEMLERYLNSVKYKDDFVTLEMYESVKTNMKVNKFNLINIYDFFRIIKNKYFYRNLIEHLKMKEREKYVTTRNNIN